jgi:hypothetical protein
MADETRRTVRGQQAFASCEVSAFSQIPTRLSATFTFGLHIPSGLLPLFRTFIDELTT